jgi:hypothetical protein
LARRLGSARRNSALILLAVVVIGLTSFAQTQAGQTALHQLGVVGPSERYTELAFVGAQHLPAQVPRAGVAAHLAFTIVNRAGRARSYAWTVLERMSATETRQLMAGETSLRDGQRAYLDPKVTLSCISGEARVDVRLTSGELIDFIVKCSGPLSNAEFLQRELTALAARWRPGTPGTADQRWLERALRALLAQWRPGASSLR